jgi:hypothetical protein
MSILAKTKGKLPEEKTTLTRPKARMKKTDIRCVENNQEKKTDETVVRDPEDSGIRVSDLWGQVAIRRAVGTMMNGSCYLDTVIIMVMKSGQNLIPSCLKPSRHEHISYM